MSSDENPQSDSPELPATVPSAGAGSEAKASGEQLVDELGRLGRKFVEVLETAWNSEQRRQVEHDLRTGLNSVASSLEEGLKDVSQKEETKEFIDKAENVADNVAEKVRASELANELARGLATGLHTLADELDKLAREMRAAHAAKEEDRSQTGEVAKDIPISTDDSGPGSAT